LVGINDLLFNLPGFYMSDDCTVLSKVYYTIL
jgi:hypothetical protein